jgi:hypothetical protein
MFKINMYAGILYAGLSGHVFKGREPWDLKNYKTDSESTEKKEKHKVTLIIKGNKILKTRQYPNLRPADQPPEKRYRPRSRPAFAPKNKTFQTRSAP